MPRRLQDNELDTAAARRRLRPREDPYWRRVSRCCHLGYRRNRSHAGRWICRFYDGSRYIKKAIGSADDTEAADGVRSLNFDQAVARAREWFAEQAREAEGVSESPARYTVRTCLEDYLDWYRVHRKGTQQVTYSVNAHILPVLGHLEVKRLTSRRLRKWHENLACSPARLRTKAGEPPGSREATTPEEQRKRKATANRVLSIFKAGLNRAFHEGYVSSDESWRRVKPFRGVEEPKIDYLSREEARRLCEVSDPTFRPVIQAALLTGCRYGELIRLDVGDYKPDARAVYVRDSKGGRPRFIYLNAEGVAFFATHTRGKPGQQPMFLRPDGTRWRKSHQVRRITLACQEANLRRISFHTLRHTYGSQLAMQGVELTVIAEQLGHADTRITQRHYAHLAPSYVAHIIEEKFPDLGILDKRESPLTL